MKTIDEIWDIYRKCWSDSNSDQRTQKLSEVLSHDFEYKDPNFMANGYQELSNYMKEFQVQFSGASFITTAINSHHDRSLMHWNMINDKHEVVSNGISFVEHKNNKIKQITGFFKES